MKVITKKNDPFEQVYIVGGDVVFFFPCLLEPKGKYQSKDKEYAVTVFVDEETKNKLESHTDDDGLFLNKQFFQVGVDKNKKKKIKFPLSNQLKKGEEIHYDEVEGMYGFSLTAPEFKKSGKSGQPVLLDKDNKIWPDGVLIGNGSKGTVRMWGYRNDDGQLNVTLDLVQVFEHVPFEPEVAESYHDDVLGIDIPTGHKEEPEKQAQEEEEVSF